MSRHTRPRRVSQAAKAAKLSHPMVATVKRMREQPELRIRDGYFVDMVEPHTEGGLEWMPAWPHPTRGTVEALKRRELVKTERRIPGGSFNMGADLLELTELGKTVEL